MQTEIEHNYNQIKADVKQIMAEELKRIAADPDLQHLIKKEWEPKKAVLHGFFWFYGENVPFYGELKYAWQSIIYAKITLKITASMANF